MALPPPSPPPIPFCAEPPHQPIGVARLSIARLSVPHPPPPNTHPIAFAIWLLSRCMKPDSPVSSWAAVGDWVDGGVDWCPAAMLPPLLWPSNHILEDSRSSPLRNRALCATPSLTGCIVYSPLRDHPYNRRISLSDCLSGRRTVGFV
jgi:hypothetical protein